MKITLKHKRRFRLKNTKKFKALSLYNRELAARFHDVRYYETIESDIKMIPYKDEERKRLATRRRQSVTRFIKYYKTLYNIKSQGVFKTLENIHNKNRNLAFNSTVASTDTKTTNILKLVSSLPMLAVAYYKIRKNKGAATLGYILSKERYDNLSGKQKSFLNQTFKLDGISKSSLIEASRLLRKGKYPWGSSRRIYVEKPGKPGALRPITIPPFMDRVVQASIQMVLEAIYEPWFEKANCSFGFRPHKGVHDAIYSIMHYKNNGLNHAIEGDIKSAYDKVNKEKLIEILSKKIKDNKFLNLIRTRLDYQFFDSASGKGGAYITEKEGLPQGGIDSPYLWNIYMMEFDSFVKTETSNYFDDLNKGLDKVENPMKRRLERKRYGCKWLIYVFNKFRNQHDVINNIVGFAKPKVVPPNTIIAKGIEGRKDFLRQVGWTNVLENKLDTNIAKYQLIDILNKLNHEYINLPRKNQNKETLRFCYARYADDWIVLTNAPTHINLKLKEKYKDFLWNTLHASLSEEKTVITDFRSKAAKFLGFEIRTARGFKVGRYQRNVQGKIQQIKANTTGCKIKTYPDKQRLLDRFHIKGYCDKDGFPREIGFLIHLEPHIIIERFNSVIQGIANFYTEFICLPNFYLSRWVYILTYSCYKTFAQKFKSSIKKILKRFHSKMTKHDKAKTIEVKVQTTVDGIDYQKTWRLLTLKQAMENARKIKRLKEVAGHYKNLDLGIPIRYNREEGAPSITTFGYLDKIKWVNLRTQAQFDSPCSICGSNTNVEMHHIKHIRKSRYELIPENNTWEKLMYLRNRKQIPVCRECHVNVIHKGKYGGRKLTYLAPKTYYDGRLMVLESHIHKGKEQNYIKTLEERGWERS
jgi:hypothetical protein